MLKVLENDKYLPIYKAHQTRYTAQKMKFSIKDFFREYGQICRKLWIWSHLLKKSLMENLSFCAVFGMLIMVKSAIELLECTEWILLWAYYR